MFALAAGALACSALSFLQKGFLLNNAYLYATKAEREQMHKKPYYMQSGVVFALIGLVFVCNGFSVLFALAWGIYAVIALLVAAILFAVFSSVWIEKSKQRSGAGN